MNIKNDYIWNVRGQSSNGYTCFSVFAADFAEAFSKAKSELDSRYVLVEVRLLKELETTFVHNSGK